MRLHKPLAEFVDDRGRLVTLFNDARWVEANYLESRADVVRGNHYHRHTHEMVFMLEGEVEIHVVNVQTGQEKRTRLKPGELICIEPYEAHAFRSKTFGRWLNFLSVAYDAANPYCTRLEIGAS